MRIGEYAVFKYLQKHIENIGVRLFDFIKKNYRVGVAPYLFGKLTALFKADISGRRAHKAGNRVLFHIFGHIKPYHHIFAAEHSLRQRLAKLGFTYTRRS